MSKTSKKTDEKTNLLGLTCSKSDNFAQWYIEVITKAELIDYYDVSGCYILRPWVFHVWEMIQKFINDRFSDHNIKNCYFPMFVTKNKLESEQEHIEGFSAEVAWVTKSGCSDLTEPIAIRPTSETIMYPAFSKWIRSHRDLPLKVNQWCPVVRWEFSDPTPFIRTREFLWQEGHSAHANSTEATTFALAMLNVYKNVYEDLLAIPVTSGRKSNLEKFCGGHTTYTVEAYVSQNGRSIQAATSHYLGSNFARIFEVEFEDESRKRQFVHQTSFGLSTRSVSSIIELIIQIGAMIMIHGDDKGLVLPPRVAPVQVIIIPIVTKNCDEKALLSTCEQLKENLSAAAIYVECDDRECYNPGWKYNHWELKGVPIRVEIGPRDISEGTCRLVRRVDGFKRDITFVSSVTEIKNELEDIHSLMLAKQRETLAKNIKTVKSFDEVMTGLEGKKLILAPWCETNECEENIKKKTARLSQAAETTLSGAMKSLCMPLEQPTLHVGTKCFNCSKLATSFALWGRSY